MQRSQSFPNLQTTIIIPCIITTVIFESSQFICAMLSSPSTTHTPLPMLRCYQYRYALPQMVFEGAAAVDRQRQIGLDRLLLENVVVRRLVLAVSAGLIALGRAETDGGAIALERKGLAAPERRPGVF